METNLVHLIVIRALIPSFIVYLLQIWMQRINIGYHLVEIGKRPKQRFWIIIIIIYISAIVVSQDVWKDVVVNDQFEFSLYWHGYGGFVFFNVIAMYFIWNTNRKAWKVFYCKKNPRDFEKIKQVKRKA
jgi:hypothetical protein